MNFFRSEFGQNYSRYSFAYTNYATREDSKRSEVLALGYLPYTGSPKLKDHCYYLARSLRVPTRPFNRSSENRRVFRKFEDIEIQHQMFEKNDFQWDNTTLSFCRNYANERFSTSFTEERLQTIIHHDHGNRVLTFTHENQLVGLVLLGTDDQAWHY